MEVMLTKPDTVQQATRCWSEVQDTTTNQPPTQSAVPTLKVVTKYDSFPQVTPHLLTPGKKTAHEMCPRSTHQAP